MANRVEITDGWYAASWGLTDLYEDSEERLRSAIESGLDFETDWGCKKEIRYAAVKRENGRVVVSVSAHMDDLFESDDLIYDALWARLHTEDELSDDVIESIREFAIDDGIADETQAEVDLPYSATFKEICEAIEKLEDEAESNNDEMFNRLQDIVEFFSGDNRQEAKGEDYESND